MTHARLFLAMARDGDASCDSESQALFGHRVENLKNFGSSHSGPLGALGLVTLGF